MDKDGRDFEDAGKGRPNEGTHATGPATGRNEGSHDADPRTDATASNVVRLPRDWLGPREELIPFGPRASESPAAPSPSDFWGEHSADMHHALQGPDRVSEPTDTDRVPREEAPVPREEPSRPDGARQKHHRPPKPQPRAPRGTRSPRWRRWAEQGPIAAGYSTSSGSQHGLRRRLVVGGALAAVVVALIIASVIGGRRAPSTAGGGLHLSVADLLRGDLSTGHLRLPAKLEAPPRTRAHHSRRVVHRSRHRSSPSSASVPVSTSPTRSSSSSSTSSPTSTGSGVSSSSGSTSGSRASAGSGSGSSSDGGSGGSSSTSSSAPGPVGAGAAFGPGHLG